MSTFRTNKDKNYFTAHNEPFNDNELSWEARGLLGYLLSKPDGWVVRMGDLLKQSDAGRHKIRRIIKELEDAGYMRRYREHDDEGQFVWVTDVYERKQMNPDYSPSVENPPMDEPPMDKPIVEEPADIVSTDSVVSTESSKIDPTPHLRWEQISGQTLSIPLEQQITSTVDDYGESAVMAALEKAAPNHPRSWTYIERILQNGSRANGSDANQSDAWQLIEQAITGSATMLKQHPQVIATVRKMGGWSRFKNASEKEWPWIRKEFDKQYRQVAA